MAIPIDQYLSWALKLPISWSVIPCRQWLDGSRFGRWLSHPIRPNFEAIAGSSHVDSISEIRIVQCEKRLWGYD